jgi:hypothetical protein
VTGSTEQREPRARDGRRGSLDTLRRRPVQIAKALATAVTFAATGTGLIFGLWPALKPDAPPATRRATLTNVTLDHIRFGQYLDRKALSRSGYPRAQLERPGALVSFDFNIRGYRNKDLPLQWQLVDATSGDQVARSRDLLITPEANEEQNSWPVWVPVPRGRSRRFFVEIELFDDRGAVPLGRIRTDRFGGA